MTLAVLVAVDSDRLVTVDASDPTNPVQLGSISTTDMGNLFGSVEIKGNTAFFTSYGDGFLAVDVTDPANPAQIGMISTTELGGAYHNDLVSEIAYVTNDDGNYEALVAIDISDPTAMSQLGFLDDPDPVNSPRGVRVVDNIASVADGHGGGDNGALHTVDVSDPANMVLLDTISDSSILNTADGVLVENGYAYVTAYASGTGPVLTVIDVSSPSSITHVSSLVLFEGSSSQADWLDKVENTIFVTVVGLERLYAVDATDPSAMTILGEITISDTADPWGIRVIGDYAYIADDQDDALVIINISDPANMVEVGRVSTPELDGARYVAIGTLPGLFDCKIHDYDPAAQPEGDGEEIETLVDSGQLGWNLAHDGSSPKPYMGSYLDHPAVVWPSDLEFPNRYEAGGFNSYWTMNFSVLFIGIWIGERSGTTDNPGFRRELQSAHGSITTSWVELFGAGTDSSDFWNNNGDAVTEDFSGDDNLQIKNNWYREVSEVGETVLFGGRFMGEKDGPGRAVLRCHGWDEPVQSDYVLADLGYAADWMRIQGFDWKMLRVIMWCRALSNAEWNQAREWAISTYDLPLSCRIVPLRFQQRDDSEFVNNPNDPRVTTGGQAPTTRQNSIRHSGQTYW